MARQIDRVIGTMIEALREDDAPSEAISVLATVLESVSYTPPEAMVNRWWDLTGSFNVAAFGDLNNCKIAPWRREAPLWARRAGQILAGEIDVGAGTL